MGFMGKLTRPTQVPTQGQWWSNFSTQLSQTAQWEQRGGLQWLQVVHHLVWITKPLIWCSLNAGRPLHIGYMFANTKLSWLTMMAAEVETHLAFTNCSAGC